MNKSLNEGHLGLILGISAFIYFVYIGLTRENITTEKDLIEVEGTYAKHSFKDNRGFKNFTHQYYIWTDNYKNSFQVKADYLKIFNRKDFLVKVKQADKVKFTIPAKLFKDLDSEKNIQVTSVEVGGYTYLYKNEVLKIERNLASSNADYYFGTGFLIVGLFSYMRKRK